MDASIEGDGWIYRKNTKGGFKHYKTDSKFYKKKKLRVRSRIGIPPLGAVRYGWERVAKNIEILSSLE